MRPPSVPHAQGTGTSAASHQPSTLADFLAWEERQESRYEFDGHRARAMTGGTYEHDAITYNVRKALDRLLVIVQGKTRYPDCLLTCAPISEDSARTGRIEKVSEDQATTSIQRYIIAEQRGVGALALARDCDRWLANAATGGDALAMPEIGIEVPLLEFYRGVDFNGVDGGH
jgi:hypothetical protein